MFDARLLSDKELELVLEEYHIRWIDRMMEALDNGGTEQVEQSLAELEQIE